MESAIVLNAEDIKEIIAKHFNIEPSKVIKSQYTYTVIGVKCRELINFGGIGNAIK